MRQIFVLLLLLLAFRCTKVEGTYAIVCEFPPGFGVTTTLVMTDAEGNIIEAFDIPDGASSFSQSFSVSEKGELPERYDLHLVRYDSDDLSSHAINIFSHLDVPNGSGVYFAHISSDANFFYRYFNVKVSGIESFDTLQTIEYYGVYNIQFSDAKKEVEGLVAARRNHDLVLKIRANGDSEFKFLYIPDSLLRDSMELAWEDFKPENNFKNLQFPNFQQISFLEVSAVAPDLQHGVVLFQSGLSYNGLLQMNQPFLYPEGVPDPASYFVRVNQGSSYFQKIFAPDEPLVVDPPEIKIKSAGNPGGRLTVQTEGDIDLIRAVSFKFEQPNRSIFWQIDGAPQSFKDRKLPSFKNYLPATADPSGMFSQGQVHAYQFGKYNYDQVRSGFPFKLSNPFEVAEGGHLRTWKDY